jgi:EmrB/QacA subfamily drug resistance transporter
MSPASRIRPIAATRNLLGRNSNALLTLVCLAQFMVILDVAIVNVALPAIRGSLGFSTTGLQWVVNAYTLTFAGFLLLGGRASDLLGRRRVFLAGTALFSLTSLVCAVAGAPGVLLGARALQGIGGAVISSASLAIITSCFEEGAPRNRALGAWGALGGLGATSGVLLGGVLTQGFGWPAIFIINVPIGAAIALVGPRIVPEGRSVLDHRNFDLFGAVLVTVGMLAVVFGIVRTDVLGWGSPGVLAPLAAGAALLATFVLHEGRWAAAPLMPLGILRMRLLRAANLVILLLYSAIFAMWFFLSLYMQQDLGHDAIETGLAFLPMTLSVATAATLAPRFVQRIGARATLSAGMVLAAAGLALLTGVRPGGTYLEQVLPGGVLAALGLGLSLVPATIAAVQGVPMAQSGLASALLNTSRLMGGALGLAVLTTLAETRTHSRLAAGASAALAQTDGYKLAFLVGAALCSAGAVLAAVLLRGGDEPVAEQVDEPVAEQVAEAGA